MATKRWALWCHARRMRGHLRGMRTLRHLLTVGLGVLLLGGLVAPKAMGDPTVHPLLESPERSWVVRARGEEPIAVLGTSPAASRIIIRQGGRSAMLAGAALRDVSAAGFGVAPEEVVGGYRLTIKGIDEAGAAAQQGLVMLDNMDDARRFSTSVGFTDGQVTVQVPPGRYAATAIFFGFRSGGVPGTVYRLAVAPEFSVAGATTLTLDARRATVSASVRTPRPASVAEQITLVGRFDPAGNGHVLGAGGGPNDIMYVEPTEPVRTGSLHLIRFFRSFSSASATDPYSYDLLFDRVGRVPAVQDYRVRQEQLAVLDARYFSDMPARPQVETRSFIPPWGVAEPTVFHPLIAPLRRVEYVLTAPGVAWRQAIATYAPDGNVVGGLMVDTVLRAHPRGEHRRVEWLRPPLVPRPDTVPSRVGDAFDLDLYPLSDGDGHLGLLDSDSPGQSSSFTLTENGRTVATGVQPRGRFPVSAAPAQYRLVYQVSRTVPWSPLSVSTQTEWAFGSDPSQNGPLPVLDLSLRVARLDDSAAAPLGGSEVLRIDGRSPRGPAIATTVEVSFDGGRHWVPESVRALGGGRFLAVIHHRPKAGASVGLRVTAWDAGGSRVSQTIGRAYALTQEKP